MDIRQLRAMLGGPHDTAMLRLSLGRLLLAQDDAPEAVSHLREAVRMDPDYTAAWKELGRALAKAGQTSAARDAFDRGIAVAQKRGDKQAEKEMQVFTRRLDR